EAASPRVRAAAARGWGHAAGVGGRWAEAMAGFDAAAGMLARVVPRSLTRADREHLLAAMGGLAADAAACCAQAGTTDRAVELFEQGRGVLLGQALDTRTDVTALADRHPDMAKRFADLCEELDRADEPTVAETIPEEPSGQATFAGPTAAARTRAQRETATAAFDRLITEIRGLDGFANFLQPPPAAQLQTLAAHGPIVVVAVSALGSHALLLTHTGIDPVPLPALTPEAVYDRVIGFLDALADTSSPAIQTAGQQRLDEVLGWLWDSLAGPVLDRLGIHAPPEPGQPWPQVWWCTTGLLSFLPVHAAGHHRSRFDPTPATVIDRVISSYTPTIRALTHARRPSPAGTPGAAGGDGAGMVAVAMPHTPDASDLPGAQAETTWLAEHIPGQVSVLTGAAATQPAVLAALPQARWAHFACHGTAEIGDPSTSRLLLHDQPLSVVDVARLRLADAELAFLSACETARPGARLTDEAIHLAAAFQLAGYRHVIGTLWPIGDGHAVDITRAIYTAITTTGDIASAVHTATRHLRNRWADRPSVWASHIHVGG
ncbi:CHAT domain-containing protein, partial [Frankia sp. Cj3]|uniref:CHAT domain-containing protein n=1 Tax=Frankia sp. Cj3 TaxID=2880976 RepID=UPI001EF70A58